MQRGYLGRLAIALAAIVAFPGAPAADTITLTTLDGSMTLVGELRSFKDGMIVIATSVGEVTIPANQVECEGEGCPDLGPMEDRAAMSGAAGMATRLMPALALGLADLLDADVEQTSSDGGAVMRLIDFDGAPLVSIAIAASGDAAGFEALLTGGASIALAGRAVDDDEVKAFAKAGFGDMRAPGREHVAALDGIAIITAPDNPVTALSPQEIAGIFAGKIGDWSEVGGPAGPVALYAPDDGADETEAFRTMVLAPNAVELAAGAARRPDGRAIAAAVAADPAAIGFIAVSMLRDAHALGLRNACGQVLAPDEFSLKSEEYPLTRRLRFYTNGQPLQSWARDILDFALSAEAQRIVAEAGYVNQDIAAQPQARMVDRLALAVTDPYADLNVEQLRGFVAETRDAIRLSATLRSEGDTDQLDAKATADIRRLVDYLAKQDLRGREVLLLGFTGPAGKASTNRARSLARAKQALELIRGEAPAGVLDDIPMRALGFGETAPVTCNPKASGDPANDRVEVWLNPLR